MIDVSDLSIYRARVYKRGKQGDDRLQVRILPLMADITDSKELNNLPKFPPLNKGLVFNCRQEATSKLKYSNGTAIDGRDTADYVCVVSNSDFTYGYVLCLENQFYSYMGNNYLDSWGFSSTRDYINNRGLADPDLKYEFLRVQTLTSTPDGGLCEFYNWKNGNKYIINESGACIMILQDKIYIRVGSPGKNNTKNPFSAIEMTSSSITFKTPKFDINADEVILGHHGQYLLATACKGMPISSEGVNLQPIKTISV